MLNFKFWGCFIVMLGSALLNAESKKIIGFENAILDTSAEIQTSEGKTTTKSFTDGDLHNELTISDITIPNGSVITINPRVRIHAKGIQIFSGNMRAVKNPSGSCALKSVVVEAFVNGQWVELVKEDNIKDYDANSELPADSFFYRFDFSEPYEVDSLRVIVKDSHDTGKRKSGITDKRLAVIREIQFFSTTPMDKQFTLSDLIKAEYTLPVYRNTKEAKLTVVVADKEQSPKEAELVIFSPENEQIYSQKISLNVGENTKVIDISNFKNGRYCTLLKTRNGTHKRLLRIDNIPEIAYPTKPLNVANKKFLFTPDKITFKHKKNVSVKVSQADTIEITRQPDEQHLALKSSDFYPTEDGSFVMEVVDYKYRNYFKTPSGKRILISDKLEGPYKEVKSVSKQRVKAEPLRQVFRPDAPIVPFGKEGPTKIKYQLYNKEIHGEIPANNVRVLYSYDSLFLDFVRKPIRASWSVGKTAKGEWVVFSKKPLFTDLWRYYGDKYDDGWQTNDNFAGQWMSFEEGKNELFFAMGQTLRRDEPYDIPYDNIASFRYLALYSTTNGTDWKFRNYLDIPTEDDKVGSQHYGGYLMQMKNADLALFYCLEYDCVAQQIYLDLKYTRNGIHFYRFPNSEPFLRTFNPKDWYFGHVFITPRIYRVGNKYVQEISRGSNSLHFSAEIFLQHNKLSEITTDSVKNRFEKRRFDTQFTFFKMLGGYEGIAKHCSRQNRSAGVLTFRVDGWFAVVADDVEGSFTTNVLTGAKNMSANYEVQKDGYIFIELKDINGNVLQTKRLTGDSLNVQVFENIPVKEFYLDVKMKNAKIYALYFK